MANHIDLSRKPRSTETRESEVRQVSWKPSHDLPVPDPIDGYVFRWVRVAMMGNPDATNMAKAQREGWVPCKASDHPCLLYTSPSPRDYAASRMPSSA